MRRGRADCRSSIDALGKTPLVDPRRAAKTTTRSGACHEEDDEGDARLFRFFDRACRFLLDLSSLSSERPLPALSPLLPFSFSFSFSFSLSFSFLFSFALGFSPAP